MSPRTVSHPSITVHPKDVHATIGKHMLADGEHLIIDLAGSHGPYLRDEATGREYLDFYAYFASMPIGHNHPKLREPWFVERLAEAALHNPANADVYTTYMAEFVETFARIARPADMPHLFFITGGALAVENALKTAFDWKVRKNLAAGKGEKGSQIIHFREAFHGRSGYTLSLTNTADPRKYQYFPRFDWPRIINPKLRFPITDQVLAETIAVEQQAIAQIQAAVRANPDEIAALIIEPIQGEGGDNHFRPEFLQELRRLADENDFLLIVDEVQTGMGATGTMWASEQMGDQTGHHRVRQEGANVRHHRRAAHRRGAGQRLCGVQPHQLDLGRQPGGHGARPALPGDHRRRWARRKRRPDGPASAHRAERARPFL